MLPDICVPLMTNLILSSILSHSTFGPFLCLADNLSEDDMNECVKEDPLDEIDGVAQTSDGSKKKTKTKTKRKDDILGMRWVGFMYLT